MLRLTSRLNPEIPTSFETTGYAEVLGRPRPPASTGSWDDVWRRVDQDARPPARPVGWGAK